MRVEGTRLRVERCAEVAENNDELLGSRRERGERDTTGYDPFDRELEGWKINCGAQGLGLNAGLRMTGSGSLEGSTRTFGRDNFEWTSQET